MGTISVLKSSDLWIPANDKDAFRPCRCSADTINLSTNDIEDPVSHAASTLRLRSAFTNLMRNTGSPPCLMFVATALVPSEAPVVASLFGKALYKTLLCRRTQLKKLQVLLLQSFD